MKHIWIKLFLEILDDPKMGRLPDWLWRRAVELFLLAGENGNDGLLQPVMDMAWRLRTSPEKLTESLQALSQVGVVHETPEGWVVTHFKERQYSESMERTRRYRERHDMRHSDGVSDAVVTEDESLSNSSSVSSDEERGGVGEKTAEELFTDAFGNFLGKRETSRWITLFEAVGRSKAYELITWAFKKEIHLMNRGGLLDSLETAAKNWREKSNGNGKKQNIELPKGVQPAMSWLAKKKAQEAQDG